MLARHQQSLEDLRVEITYSDEDFEEWSVAHLLSNVGGLPSLKALTLSCHMTSAIAATVAAACPALEFLRLRDEGGLDDEKVWGCWAFPEALPRLSKLEWESSDYCFVSPPPGLPKTSHYTGFSHMMRGRRLRELALLRRARRIELGVACLDVAAALPVELFMNCSFSCTRTFLERLADGPAEVATLRKLTLVVDGVSATTLSPLSHLTGLIDLTLHVDELRCMSWPCLPRLKKLSVVCSPAFDRGEDWGSCLLGVLAASSTRHTLEVLHLGGIEWESDADASVAAAAPRMRALRRLTMDKVEWTFARGTVVGRSAEKAQG